MSPWRPFGSKLVTNVSNPWRWICTLAVAVSAGAFVGSEFVTNVIGYEVVLKNTFQVSFPRCLSRSVRTDIAICAVGIGHWSLLDRTLVTAQLVTNLSPRSLVSGLGNVVSVATAAQLVVNLSPC